LQALVQRVSSAEIFINEEQHAKIQTGLLAFVCFESADVESVTDQFIKKISEFTFFDDVRGVMALNLKEIDGELMLVSQFTLAAITNKGNKPSFHKAAKTDDALLLYNQLIGKLDQSSINYQAGEFGANMNVALVNNGPVTFSFNF
jgi:D-tyrosyl-tRNA(Tyr) deacylase